MASRNYYNPRTLDLTVPGIRRSTRAKWDWKDYWTGSMESLVAAGFATPDMFPGQPGRPVASVSFRPIAENTNRDLGAHLVPGYMIIKRLLNGGFSVELTVSREEQSRREEQRKRDETTSRSQPGSKPDTSSVSLREPRDLDRLFVRRIIDERARPLFGKNFEWLCQMTPEERWDHMERCCEEADENESFKKFDKSSRAVMVEILSDLEAWVTVERVRHASRKQVSTKRGRTTGPS